MELEKRDAFLQDDLIVQFQSGFKPIWTLFIAQD